MPRAKNRIASRARRKKILNRTKGYFGRRKNVWTVAKNTREKGQLYATVIAKSIKEHLEVCGLPVSMRAFANMACRTQYLWVTSQRRVSN